MTDLTLRAGKLEQSCPDCGRWEAAGAYCSGCGRSMGAADWYPNGDLERRAVARQKAPQRPRTPVKGGRVRPRADLATTPLSAPAEDTAAVREPHARAVDGSVSSAGVPRGRQGQREG